MGRRLMPYKFTAVFFSLLATIQCWGIDNSTQENPAVNLCRMDKRNHQAVEYVGTRPSGGRVQLGLLLLEGLQKEDFVLEIGAGALMSSIPIMSFLEMGHYIGIEPNQWLMNASLKIPENREVVEKKKPTFLPNTDFDASSLGITFDYIFAHSIMSHAAEWQLPLFLKNCAKVLKEGGKVVFSIRLTEANGYGCEGADQETHASEWQYPGCSFFDKTTVEREASKWFSKVEYKKEYTALLTSDSRSVCHDWFVLTK